MAAINSISRLDNSSLMEEVPEAAIKIRAIKTTTNILNSIIINIRTAMPTVAQAEAMVSSIIKRLQLSSAILSPTTPTGTNSLSSPMLAIAMQATMLKTTALEGIEESTKSKTYPAR